MPVKRKHASFASKGLAPGQQLKRSALPNSTTSWAWVGTEVVDPSNITPEHLKATCGLSKKNRYPFCANKYAPAPPPSLDPKICTTDFSINGELENDVIVVSDDEPLECSKKLCKCNPNCLNYLGQEIWEDNDEAWEIFLKAANLGENPIYHARDVDLPVGLKNLGATCYANASLQVWFRDLAFRSGVYKCQPTAETEKFKESPIYQLQVTFAGLQESTQSVFNPTKLVESLQLRTTEQQDAQEFSKLFMSHLDAEFKKQSIPSVKSLIIDQFQGKQVYGTVCHRCQYRSERAADFLEIEINFENNSSLEDRIAALLQPETLSGDNKYLCSRCDSLQDATRYTELRELPPVLHFSLLRFVYDVTTMERKKSKHAISFPTILDMNRFLGCAEARKLANAGKADVDMYELRGVLLHKGASAYHGHYEAQVYDATNMSWFQFNDETVTKIKTLDSKANRKDPVIDVEDDNMLTTDAHGPAHRVNARKRQRIDDSDDEVTTAGSSTSLPKHLVSLEAKPILSKDAYMLIYARKESESSAYEEPATTSSRAPVPVPIPPPHALDAVSALNDAHDEACEAYDNEEKLIRVRFEQTRRRAMHIYQNWSVSSCEEDSVVLSQRALETWLSKYITESALQNPDDSPMEVYDDSANGFAVSRRCQRSIPIKDILCTHQRIDPSMEGNMKRINRRAYEEIVAHTHCAFEPYLNPNDVCGECVRVIFTERLYQIEHPRLISQFDQINEMEIDTKGYWISKLWLRDWKLVKPKMHVVSEGDPAPDAYIFENHVRCEHGRLSLNTTTRRRISSKAAELLKGLYPSWNPLSTDEEPCALCDALIYISKEDKREVRKKAEEEKAKLKHMHDSMLFGDMELVDNEPCAIIPAQFLKSWKQWLSRPADFIRPDTVDNTSFICEHDLLAFDPNSASDLDASLSIIKRSDWDVLETLYPGGPLIAIEKRTNESDGHTEYLHDVPVCVDCRLRRKSDWDTTEIAIRLHNKTQESPIKPTSKKAIRTYSRKNGVRQSMRLKQVKEFGERRKITISKSMTVKEIKIIVQDELFIPTICQRLYLRGQELDDNTAMVSSLEIYANDVLDLREEHEVHEIDSDFDDVTIKKQRREEGGGFGGTLLGGSSSSGEDTPVAPIISEKPCSVCTFSNSLDALSCSICDTLFL